MHDGENTQPYMLKSEKMQTISWMIFVCIIRMLLWYKIRPIIRTQSVVYLSLSSWWGDLELLQNNLIDKNERSSYLEENLLKTLN